ncbi:hypothetical protein AC578_2762 [Pseudocercospora eumusae]|uniref:Uncharacterized protein n=1 Tax=Pseudocercospora eumusae TaxID=321146 RepID=A0A139HGP1_9PEZI|nr:hypothetical protein AC578_2762 [Pseudocercospora eumusae]
MPTLSPSGKPMRTTKVTQKGGRAYHVLDEHCADSLRLAPGKACTTRFRAIVAKGGGFGHCKEIVYSACARQDVKRIERNACQGRLKASRSCCTSPTARNGALAADKAAVLGLSCFCSGTLLMRNDVEREAHSGNCLALKRLRFEED